MAELPPHRSERIALCDLFLARGPDAPTLNEGWQTHDLALHLFIRERKPLAAVGIFAKGPFERILDRTTEKLRTSLPYEQLIEKIRTGPPVPIRWIDGAINTQEYFVHHEDVRRGDGNCTPRPVVAIADVEAALWKGLRRTHRMFTRSLKGLRVDLVNADGETIHSGDRKAAELVSIVGRPGELVIYLTGRREAAQVEIRCSDSARRDLDAAHLGI